MLPLHFANELASPIVEEPKQNQGDFTNGERRCFGDKSWILEIEGRRESREESNLM